MPIRIKRGQTLPLLLTPAERDAVVKQVMPPTLEDKLQLGLAKDGEVEFQLTLDELEDLQGWVCDGQPYEETAAWCPVGRGILED